LRFLEQTREQNRDFWSRVWTREQIEISRVDFGQENKAEISGADFRKKKKFFLKNQKPCSDTM
jgi:hypothetical protein